MEEKELEKFKKYIGNASPIELEAEDGTKETFYLKPLSFEDIGDLIMLGRKFAKFSPGDKPEKFIEALDEDTLEKLKKIVEKTIEISYPDIPKEVRDSFASKNFFALIEKIFEINSLGAPKSEIIKKRIEKMRRIKK